MQSIPAAMASALKKKNVDILLDTQVAGLTKTSNHWDVQTPTELTESEIVVLATDAWSLGGLLPEYNPPKYRSQRCLWLTLDRIVDCGPSLILNPDRQSPFMTVAPMHAVDPDRAPKGKSLFAVTVRADHFTDTTDEIVQSFHQAMQRNKVITPSDSIACIADQTVQRAQFVQDPNHFRSRKPSATLPDGLYVCGEHLLTSSINGALESGIAVADEIVRTLSSKERLWD
jgi:predicted NAD/FAD-dependent oxidoreductase